jgi:imidazolonepropionase-like amidohydrolase
MMQSAPLLGFLTLFAALGPRVVAQEVSGPQGPPYRPSKPIALVGGYLIDGTGASPRHDQTVVIEGERITQVGPMDQVKVPADAQVIDASGMSILPGLINSNQHVQLNPLYPSPTANLPLAEIKARWEDNWRRMPERAFVYLMQGITSLRQTSGPAKQILPVKKAIDRGEIPGPRLFLGGALFTSDEHFRHYTTRQFQTPADAVEWMRTEFAYQVISDPDRDTEAYAGEDFNYWKLYLSNEKYDGANDFSDMELRFIIDKAHRLGKKIDVHCGGHNDGLRRMLAFDVDTLEHPFYGHQLVDMDIIEGYAKKGVIVDTLLTVMIVGTQRASDPHRLSETLYSMTLEPREHRILMQYRDKMLANLRKPDAPGLSIYGGGTGLSYAEQLRRMATSRENLRRFVKAGSRLSMGTDTGSFLNFQQEDPNANEVRYLAEAGLTPLQAVEAATRVGAEALGLENELGTIEKGKLADVIVVPGNPLVDLSALKRVYAVIKGGVRYK